MFPRAFFSTSDVAYPPDVPRPIPARTNRVPLRRHPRRAAARDLLRPAAMAAPFVASLLAASLVP